MPRRDFFSDILSTYKSQPCREGNHKDCDGIAYPGEWNERQHDCGCSCHMSPTELARLKKPAALPNPGKLA